MTTDAQGSVSSDQTLAHDWSQHGYVVVPKLLPTSTTQRLRDIAEDTLGQWRHCSAETGEPGGGDEATSMRHLNHPGYHRSDPATLAAVLSGCAHPRILQVAGALLEDEPLFRCTSLFFNPVSNSRDGNWHRDSQFHCPDEDDERKMIADGGGVGRSIQLQIALVPSDDVEVVPGSHVRWDTDAEYAIRRADEGRNNTSPDMPGAKRVDLEPGDAVAFNPIGLHRGRYHTDRLRRTLMLTYTSASHPRFDYFSNQPWFDDIDYLAGVSDATRGFFSRFVEQYGPQWRTPESD